jgi:hypothetical protein
LCSCPAGSRAAKCTGGGRVAAPPFLPRIFVKGNAPCPTKKHGFSQKQNSLRALAEAFRLFVYRRTDSAHGLSFFCFFSFFQKEKKFFRKIA